MVSLNDISLKKWQDEDLEHLRYEYDLKPSDFVIDIGSYRQEWADEIRKKGCKVECFEALDNRAAWTFDGELDFGGAYYYSSMFAEEKPYKYRCVDIAPYLKNVALLKINIEGGEYGLLWYIIEKGLINEIDNLQVQFHVMEGSDQMYEELRELLSKTHSLTWRYPFCWENWKRNV